MLIMYMYDSIYGSVSVAPSRLQLLVISDITLIVIVINTCINVLGFLLYSLFLYVHWGTLLRIYIATGDGVLGLAMGVPLSTSP